MSLVDRAKNILMKPKDEWAVIAAETPNTGQIITGYVLPMAALPLIATVLGSLIFGKFGIMVGLVGGLVGYVVSVGAVLLTALVVNALAGSFNSEKGFGRALQLVAYGYTGSWVGGLLNIIPVLGVLGSLAGGLYSIYILYLGFPHTMKTPEDKVVVYMIVVIVILIIIYMVLFTILTAIFFAIFGLTAMSMMG